LLEWHRPGPQSPSSVTNALTPRTTISDGFIILEVPLTMIALVIYYFP